jgi:hypothetical protein
MRSVRERRYAAADPFKFLRANLNVPFGMRLWALAPAQTGAT